MIDFSTKSHWIKEALRLTKERRQLFIQQIGDIRDALKEWRMDRWEWELQLVETKYMEGNTQIFSPRFAAADIANKVQVSTEM
jgi:Arc/MetJ-type ribon-helix-helix transcriptional regulator